MSEDGQGEDVISLDEVFPDDETISLTLSAEEWEVIILLAELGGSGSVRLLREKSGMVEDGFNSLVSSLIERGIAARGVSESPSEAVKSAPDAEVEAYLEYLQDLNYYQILQLDAESDLGDVRRSYFRLMREYHPDRFMKEQNLKNRENLKEIFRILTRAYETLSEPEARREYDLSIPDFTGVYEKEDEQAFEALWTGGTDVGPLPEKNPELARSFFESALEDFQREDYAAAELNFKLALSLDSEVADYKSGLAKTRRILNKDKARELAVKALYYEEEDKHGQAARAMARAAELDPEVAEYRYDLARILESHLDDPQAARMNILLALDRKPGKIDYLLLFGKIQEKLGEIPDARRTFKKILSLDKNNAQAQKALGNIEKKAKNK